MKEDKFVDKDLNKLVKIGKSKELGKFLYASTDIKKGDVLWTEKPLVVGPVAVTPPVCLCCYAPVNGSFL